MVELSIQAGFYIVYIEMLCIYLMLATEMGEDYDKGYYI
jgi:hypothetical protein